MLILQISVTRPPTGCSCNSVFNSCPQRCHSYSTRPNLLKLIEFCFSKSQCRDHQQDFPSLDCSIPALRDVIAIQQDQIYWNRLSFASPNLSAETTNRIFLYYIIEFVSSEMCLLFNTTKFTEIDWVLLLQISVQIPPTESSYTSFSNSPPQTDYLYSTRPIVLKSL